MLTVVGLGRYGEGGSEYPKFKSKAADRSAPPHTILITALFLVEGNPAASVWRCRRVLFPIRRTTTRDSPRSEQWDQADPLNRLLCPRRRCCCAKPGYPGRQKPHRALVPGARPGLRRDTADAG